jgi:hypothetical protein
LTTATVCGNLFAVEAIKFQLNPLQRIWNSLNMRPKYPFEVQVETARGTSCAPFKSKTEATKRAKMRLRGDYSFCNSDHWKKIEPQNFPELKEIVSVRIVQTLDDCFPQPRRVIFEKSPALTK